MPVYHTECSHCGQNPAAPAHDAQCWTISRAIAMVTKGIATETEYHVYELARRLADHPRPSTPQGRSAREARRQFLDHWVMLAQKEETQCNP